MFENETVKKQPYFDRDLGDGGNRTSVGVEQGKGVHPLDSPENEMLFHRLIAYHQQELDRQYDNRIEQAIDEDYYDHIQWREEDAAELALRGQAATVYNVIAQTINWIIGTEKRGRADFKVLPREKNDSKSAERKTGLLKYLSDVNRTAFDRSRAFEDATKVGIGWIEDGVQNGGDGEPIYSRYENWRNMLWDSSSMEMDLSDARYVSRTKWVDVDVAETLASDRQDVIAVSKEDGIRYGYDGQYADEIMDYHENEMDVNAGARASENYYRERVRIIEMWFRKPMKVQKIIKGPRSGEIYDESHPGHANVPPAFVAERMVMRMHCAIMTVKGLLWLGESPYRHNNFPFTPIWAYRRGRDQLPYGVIRGLRDIQDDINKRFSKTLHIISSNKIIMDKGAHPNIEVLRREAARPDAVITKKKGYEMVLNADKNLADAHLDILSRNIAMIQQVGGVTDELMGRTTNATSGVAVQNRQEQGMMSTSKLFDNLRLAFILQGEKQLSLVEQFMTEEQAFRITNERGTPEFFSVNDGMPENDIVSQKADFIVGEEDWRATIRHSQADQLMEMLTRMTPEVALTLLDLVVENMDLANREEIVKRLRQLNGQSDPDADPDDPEEKQRKAQAARQQMINEEMIMAKLRRENAAAGLDEARMRELAVKIARENMGIMDAAIDAAIKTIQVPQATRIADNLAGEAGFIGRSEEENMIAEETEAQQQEAALQQQQEQSGFIGEPAPETP